MITPTLFGIPITERAARLVAADAAEERALTDLALALRDASKPLVLETTDRLALLPETTHWVDSGQRERGWRRPEGLLLLLMQVGYRMVHLRFVPDGFDTRTGAHSSRRLDYRSGLSMDSLSTPTTHWEFQVHPGAIIIANTDSGRDLVTFFACFEDAPRFGFDLIPAFD